MVDLTKPVQTKREGWVNLYRSENGRLYAGNTVYDTRADAEGGRILRDIIATVKVEWEE